MGNRMTPPPTRADDHVLPHLVAKVKLAQNSSNLPETFARPTRRDLQPSHYKEISMSPKKKTQKSAKRATASGKGLSAEEIAAMKETLKERKRAASKEEAEKAALEAIAAMAEPDRSMAKRIHAIIKENAPGLSPTTWYGMPAYANQDG
jgi:hypothetical protein